MKQLKDAPIGVFDSGVGGLTVAREIMRNLPQEKIVYFGKNIRLRVILSGRILCGTVRFTVK